MELELPDSPGHLPPPRWVRAPSGHPIPVRLFGGDFRRPPVLILHGLQSHSAWFVHSATRIAELGFPVFAFDRCGSGVSESRCPVGPRLTGLLEEVDAVAGYARMERGNDGIYIVGHCFGALVALLYSSLYRAETVRGLVLATPALYTHTDVPARDKLTIAWSLLTNRPAMVPVPLAPEEMSEVTEYIDFVRSDPLALRTVPARLLFEVARARRMLPRAARALRAPTFVAMAGDDPVCDNRRNRALLERVSGPISFHTYRGARHVLDFSRRRDAFLADVTDWLATRVN